MSNRLMLSLVPVALAGCANVPSQPPPYETAIKSYYEAHASEKTGRCLAPYIDGFTRVQVVEDTPQRMVVEARYLYRDRVKDQSGTDDQPFSECVSYNGRTFVLDKDGLSLQVAVMSGPRRS
jgi:hypothetical protein